MLVIFAEQMEILWVKEEGLICPGEELLPEILGNEFVKRAEALRNVVIGMGIGVEDGRVENFD